MSSMIPEASHGSGPDGAGIQPLVSVIVPCRNEVRFIEACLASIVANDYPKDRLELLVIDGMSDDGTRRIIERFIERRPGLRLIDNPKRIVPTALNLGVRAARGRYIIRMDAHNDYPHDYIRTLVAWSERTGADNVGSVWDTRPGREGVMPRAIALALAHPFGVGNAYYRIGASKPTWVDTVPFGCYRREVFDRVGLFDEELVRNQDDEFNHRLLAHGGRILLVPSLVSRYYARDSLGKVSRMFYQYGFFKPLTARKVGRVTTLRQLVPAALVAWVTISALLSPWLGAARWALAGVVLTYSGCVLAMSFAAVARGQGWAGLALATVFPVVHVSYGLGFLRGVLDHLVLRHWGATRSAAVPLTR